MRIRVLPYRQGSQGAQALADALNGRVLRLQGSRFRKRPRDIIINWGNTNPLHECEFNGNGEVLRSCSNKLEFFRRLDGTGLTPTFYTRRGDIPDDAFPIVCRTVLAGHSGDGIVIADNREQLVDAPLYVQYKKKQSEFRIHVGLHPDSEIETIIGSVRKVRREGVEPTDWRVRNHANGFVFQRNGIEEAQGYRESVEAARQTFLAIEGLTFGAVDVIYNERERRAYVLEINTAPGLEGTTVDDYVRFFRNEG